MCMEECDPTSEISLNQSGNYIKINKSPLNLHWLFCNLKLDVELFTHWQLSAPGWPCTSLPRAGKDWKVGRKAANLFARNREMLEIPSGGHSGLKSWRGGWRERLQIRCIQAEGFPPSNACQPWHLSHVFLFQFVYYLSTPSSFSIARKGPVDLKAMKIFIFLGQRWMASSHWLQKDECCQLESLQHCIVDALRCNS